MVLPVNSRDKYLQEYVTRALNNSITKEEKPALKLLYDQILNAQVVSTSAAAKYSLSDSAEKLSLDAAIASLTNYLATLTIPVLWSNLDNITVLSSRDDFESKFYSVTAASTSLDLLINAQVSETDLSVPPTPTGLVTISKFASIALSWDTPVYSNLSHTEIWRASINSFASATLIGRGDGSGYVDIVEDFDTMYYWIRFISLANIEGLYNSTIGTPGTTGTNPAYILAVLEDQITASSLAADLTSSFNKIDVNAQDIINLSTVQGDTIAQYVTATTNMATEDAAIVASYETLTTTVGNNTATLTAVTDSIDGLSAEQYIKIDVNGLISGYGIHSGPSNSSFIVNATNFAFGYPGKTTKYPFIIGMVNGVSTVGIDGAMVVDGTITAKSVNVQTLSAISADLGSITAGDIKSVTIHGGDGYPTNADAWPTNGGGGYVLSPYGGLRIGNQAANKFFQVTAAGDIYTPGFMIQSGNATYWGALSAASGTFRGYVTGGAHTGYSWPSAGNYGFYLGPSGLMIGNYNNQKYTQITYDGNFYTPGFKVENGVMTISQVNVINTLNIKNNAVTIPSAISGTVGPQGVTSAGIYEAGSVVAIYEIDTDVVLLATWQARSTSNAGTNTDIYLYDNGNLIAHAANSVGAYLTSSFSYSSKIRLAAGSHSFSIRFGDTWSGSYNVQNWSLIALGVLK